MVQPTRPAANGVVRALRKIYNPIGFAKGYNALLWLIFDGALLGFVLARFEYLNFGIFCPPNGRTGAIPGECYYYRGFSRDHIGLMLHLGTILPAGLLAVFQFVPVIRHKVTLYHRIAGYIIILLVLCSHAGVLMMVRESVGGDMNLQTLSGLLVIVTMTSFGLAIYNIKRLQIDQHRAWMLRTWAYLSFIITLRIIMIISAKIVSLAPDSGPMYEAVNCVEISSMVGDSTAALYGLYPACRPGVSPDGWIAVKADFNAADPASIKSALAISFGMAGWLAFFLHAAGVEIYLHLTPREGERLRQVSYERQLERGMANPGNAGLVSIGDADKWVPKTARHSVHSLASSEEVK